MFKSALIAAVFSAIVCTTTASAQHFFTYQGSLNDAGVPATGTYDMRFTLWTDATPGAPDTQIGSTVTSPATTLADGLFTVELDLDDAAFQTNLSRYLQIEVRLNGDPAYTTLTPRQKIHYTPRALYAAKADDLTLPYIGFFDFFGSGSIFNIVSGSASGTSIRGDSGRFGFGVLGTADYPTGEFPGTIVGTGVGGVSSAAGVMGTSDNGFGVVGWSQRGTGAQFKTSNPATSLAFAVQALSTHGSTAGIFEVNDIDALGAPSLIAKTDSTQPSAFAVHGIIESINPASFSTAVRGENKGTGQLGIGVWGSHDGAGWGVYGTSDSGFAGRFVGDVGITGNLSKSGGSFKIDHPLDPENMYLSHSFVESPDMKNIYDGVITLNESGLAIVTLPTYFNALNQEFRYQLTCVGGYAPVYISSEISDRSFTIAGGNEGLKVSWQVTGVRHDAWANQNRIVVEEEKSSNDQGRYLNPKAFGQPKEKGIGYQETHQAQN